MALKTLSHCPAIFNSQREKIASVSDCLVVDADALEIPLVQAVDTFVDLYLVMPAEPVQFCHISKFADGAVGLGCIPAEFSPESYFPDDLLCGIPDADFFAGAHIDVAVAYLCDAVGIFGSGVIGVPEVHIEKDMHGTASGVIP